MNMYYSLLLNLVLFTVVIKQFDCFGVELSAIIEAGKRECYHQYLKEGLTIDVDFQVISGGDGLDITFWASSPNNVVVAHIQRERSSKPQFKTAEVGEYRFCFDNSFSRFSDKQVNFYIGTEDEYTDPIFSPQPVFKTESDFSADHLGELDEKIDNFRNTFKKLLGELEKAISYQRLFRAYESIDRHLVEANYDRINLFSTINVIVMLTVAAVQVYMIRSLFEDKSKVGRLLRGKSNVSKSFT